MGNGYFHFGCESAQHQDVGPLVIVVGDGQANKLITRVTGQVAAALYGNTDQGVHQFLFSMATLDQSGTVQLLPESMPNPLNQFTAEVDNSSLLAVNGKLAGQRINGTTPPLYAPGPPLICPFDYVFDPPVLARAGTLHAWLENRDFLNVEIHFTVQWKDP